MTQPTCPACGAALDVQLTQAGVQPGAPVPQPAPPPIPMPPDANELVSGTRYPRPVPGDPSQTEVGPNVFVAHDGSGQPLRAGLPVGD